MRAGSPCACCGYDTEFDGATSVDDDRGRAWCTGCAAGLLAQVAEPKQMRASIAADKKLREAEQLEKRAARLRAEVSK